jgi:hypothetical protein
LAQAVTPGDGLVLLFGNATNAVSVSSVSGGGVTWTRAAQENDDQVTADTEVWYGLSSTGGSKTVTLTLSASAVKIYPLNVSEWSGIGGLDHAAPGTVNHSGSSTASVASITPSGSGDLFVGAVGANASISGSPGGGFSTLSSDGLPGIGFAQLVAADAAAHQYTQSLATSTIWSGIGAAFYPAAPPAAVNITVTTPAGTSPTSSADQFTYTKP